MGNARTRIKSLFEESIRVKQKVLEADLDSLVQIGQTLAQTVKAGGKILFCGNGGSAADAQHLACEMLVRLRPHINRDAIPALCLTTDMSSITACGNDFGFEAYFERMIQGVGRKGDALVAITTSGKSPNILRALKAAKVIGVQTIGFLGCGGGPALAQCDLAFVVPSDLTGRIQESHITAGHAVLEMVEDLLMEWAVIKPLSVASK